MTTPPAVDWTPPQITCTEVSIGLPCGVHTEVKGWDKDGKPYWRLDRTGTGECLSIWCLLNSGEWEWHAKYRWIVERMRVLGWDFGKGIPAHGFYEQALTEYEALHAT